MRECRKTRRREKGHRWLPIIAPFVGPNGEMGRVCLDCGEKEVFVDLPREQKHAVWEACVHAICPRCARKEPVDGCGITRVWRHADGAKCPAGPLFQLRQMGLK